MKTDSFTTIYESFQIQEKLEITDQISIFTQHTHIMLMFTVLHVTVHNYTHTHTHSCTQIQLSRNALFANYNECFLFLVLC